MLSRDAKMQNDRSTDSHHHALLNTEHKVVTYCLNCQLGLFSSLHNSISYQSQRGVLNPCQMYFAIYTYFREYSSNKKNIARAFLDFIS